jgi:rfaE bifunctional protein nucleotidyltransferase chain/domain
VDKKDKIVLATGCFDVLHYGHIFLLQTAKLLGDKLIVGINSDASIKRLKGEGRPLFNEDIRRSQLLALRCVDNVITFQDDDPAKLLEVMKPDIFVKGKEYKYKRIPEKKVCKDNGIELVFIDDTRFDFSTSQIIKELKKNG